MPLQGGLSIERMCQLAEVSRAGFYRWLQEPPPEEFVCCHSAPSLRVNPMPPRLTQQSHRPLVSDRIVVGT
jgi:hypothetical protein